MHIERLDPHHDDGDATLVVDLWNDCIVEQMPSFPRRTIDEWRAATQSVDMDIDIFGVREGDRLVGVGAAAVFTDGANEAMTLSRVFVAKDRRRRGIGTLLLGAVAYAAEAKGRSLIVGDAFDTVPAGAAFAEAFGGTVGLVSKANLLEVDAIDWDMIRRWSAQGSERAPGYEVFISEGMYAEEVLPSMVELAMRAMDDMPFDDLELETPILTVDGMREDLERTLAVYDQLTSIARHVETGELVGYSELYRPKSSPERGLTSITVVAGEHRGHALGKWLKADLYLAMADRWPEVESIKTENAGSNDAMLGINTELGFVHAYTETAYQAPVDVVRERLGRA